MNRYNSLRTEGHQGGRRNCPAPQKICKSNEMMVHLKVLEDPLLIDDTDCFGIVIFSALKF
jgi:hypothetical protein